MALLNETNIKWTLVMRSSIKYKLNTLDRNMEVRFTDSSEYEMTKKHQLLGGLMNVIWGKVVHFFLTKKSVYNDKLGKWIAFKLTNQL